jgi:NtrC-family two-component system sensor histidine kinase KinB
MLGQTHDHTALQLRVTYDRGMAGWVARNREAVLIQDTSKDQRWLHRPDDDSQRTGPKSAVSAPIMAHEKLVGVITLVHPDPGVFMEEHLDLTRAIADQAGTAIRNAQLYESLQAAHQRYRELFEDSIDSILITDKSGKILEANRQAEITVGVGSEQLSDTSINDLLEIDWEAKDVDCKNLEPGETITCESTFHARSGRKIPVQVYVRSIQYEGDAHNQWIVRDITERKDLDSLREDLIAMVYHDLRSPLANVVSSLDVISTMGLGEQDETINSLLSIAIRSTERIQRLTDSLLDINRLEAGQTIGNREKTSPHKVVGEALDSISPGIKNKNLKLVTDIPADLPDVFIDADMIRRVMINLLENATKFSPTNETIQFEAKQDENFLKFCVKDNGPGISDADKVQIFKKFIRVSTKDGPRGLGLGLAFCHLAVLGHGGQIWVESEAGHGSEFCFTLPLENSGSS